MRATFKCKFQPCSYESPHFSRILNHVWNIHSLEPGFCCRCGISSCPQTYTNLQSFRRHVRDKHLWFFEMYLKGFNKDLPNNLNINQRDENDFSPVENIVDREEGFEILRLWSLLWPYFTKFSYCGRQYLAWAYEVF